MHIIAGALKGRRITAFKPQKHSHLRPMSQRVKESLFSLLTPYLTSRSQFLDLFSGAGSLSFEALSRGARAAWAVESHPISLGIIEKNCDRLACRGRLKVCRQDVFSFLRRPPRSCPVFDVAVADPPFQLKAGARLASLFSKSALFGQGSVFAADTGQEEELSESYPPFRLFAFRSFRDKKLWLYRAD